MSPVFSRRSVKYKPQRQSYTLPTATPVTQLPAGPDALGGWRGEVGSGRRHGC
jgi:hypothetical protein